MRRTEMRGSGVALVLCAGVLVVACPQGSSACTPSRLTSNQLPVSKILSSNKLVFVGVVTHSRVALTRGHIGVLRFITFQVEIPIKGAKGKTSVQIQYRDLGCDPGFPAGQRWFVATDHDSGNINSGSIVLADANGHPANSEQPSAHVEALQKAFPQIMKLPRPLAKDQPPDSKAPIPAQ